MVLSHLVARPPQKPADGDTKLVVVVDDVNHGGHDRSPRRRVGKPGGAAKGRASAAFDFAEIRPRRASTIIRAIDGHIPGPLPLVAPPNTCFRCPSGIPGVRIRDGRLDRRSVDASGAADDHALLVAGRPDRFPCRSPPD